MRGARRSEPLAEAIDRGKRAIRQGLQTTGIPAISVAQMTEAGVVWQPAFGRADHAASLAATTQTRFNIGSVSKVVAALAVMILCVRGLLSPDAPIAPSLPGFILARIHAALARAMGNVRLVWRLANRIGGIAVPHKVMYCSRGAQ